MTDKKTIDTITTEEKIKKAASLVFLKKGFAATRTRDIADASGENLALINYYFRSKENLYRIVMMETMSAFMNTMVPVFNEESTSLEKKIELVASNYIDLFCERPEIPLFVLNELNHHEKDFLSHMPFKQKLFNSNFFTQVNELLVSKKLDINPIQIFVSMMGMIVFPFIAAPLLKSGGKMNNKEFIDMMQERKKLIPVWIKSILSNQ